ncbi:hypothetical protein COTS27_01550 [Spirochaetota bacterium]|nr:hypothetical protein COTS27_01550 [Spirochaetota bacterium]
MRKILSKLAIFFMAAIFLVSFSFAKIKIIVVTHGSADDPFWSIVKNGVQQAGKDYRRADKLQVLYRAPTTFNMVEMARLIDQAVAERPDGLVVSIPDANALGPSIRNAVKSGIPVISINSGSDVFTKLGVTAHVGQTEYEAGLGGGRRMKASGAKKALIVNHEVGNVALDLRADGFIKGFGNGEVIGVSKDPNEIKSAVSAKFRRDNKLDAVLALGPLSGEPTYDAIKELDKIKDVKVATFDLSSKMLEAAAKGEVVFLIDQQPYLQGYLPISMLVQYKRYDTLAPGIVQTGPGFVTPKNAAKVIGLAKKGYR